MKGLFIHFFDLAEHNGISKKILSQVRALKKCGVDTDLCYAVIDEQGNHKRVCGDNVIDNFGNGPFSQFKKWFSYGNLTGFIISQGYNMVYIRSFYNTNPPMIKMLRRLKKEGIKVVMEIPTYPYDRETKGANIKYRGIFFINKLCRKFLKNLILRVVTFTDLPEIHGVKTINISNAIDFSSIEVKRDNIISAGVFNLTGVAEVHYWHGYDRVIKGIAEYYRHKGEMPDVHFNIVGDGFPGDMAQLYKLVEEEGLNERVFFHGNCYGLKLDSLFENTNFGVASLARHRTGILKIKTLKNREYAARGIPFIYSETDDDFDNMPYILKAPADDTPIDIRSIISFYNSLKITPSEIRESIVKTLTWEVQMQKVVDIISLLR